MHDLVIRNGKIVDGSGKPAFSGDVAIDAGVITAAGGKSDSGRREIQADGLLVTPGWVDTHTHYDAQVTWDPYLTPSSWHGVTTVVMGNCGVGFAPVKPGQEEFLIGLMEGVEEIPGAAMVEGIKWQWGSFADYLDALERTQLAIDVGTLAPHCAVRAYVMGERGARNEEATNGDIAEMAAIMLDALRAGALGLSSSRTIHHRTKNKELVPGTFASVAEVMAIGRAVKEAGHGIFEVVSDMTGPDVNLEWMADLSRDSGRPVSLLPTSADLKAIDYHHILELMRRYNERGSRLVLQVGTRPPSVLMALDGSTHPFMSHPTYRTLAHLSRDGRVQKLRDPQIRARILSEEPRARRTRHLITNFDNFFPLGEPPDYEQPRELSVGGRARRAGKAPQEQAYDMLMERDGREVLYMPASNYESYNLDLYRELLLDPMTTLSLSDAGAHVGGICDASAPTFLLTHWARDRIRGERLPVETVVRLQTRDTAQLFGLNDRGLLAPGMKADLNLIDFDRLQMRAPEMVFDFPSASRRFVQKVEGYKYTIVNGEVIYEDGAPTGAMPGKLIRGPRNSD